MTSFISDAACDELSTARPNAAELLLRLRAAASIHENLAAFGPKFLLGLQAIQACLTSATLDCPEQSPYVSVQSAIGRLSRLRFDGGEGEEPDNALHLAQAMLNVLDLANLKGIDLGQTMLDLLGATATAMAGNAS